MIQGVVNARLEGVVRVRVRGPGGIESDVDVIVDSGFTASLTLPMAMVTALSLARQSGGTAVLAKRLARHGRQAAFPLQPIAVGFAVCYGAPAERRRSNLHLFLG